MSRALLPASLFAVAAAVGLQAMLQTAEAGEKRQAYCYPKEVLLAAGTTPTELAGGATIFFNKMIEENNRTNFMMIQHGSAEIICTW